MESDTSPGRGIATIFVFSTIVHGAGVAFALGASTTEMPAAIRPTARIDEKNPRLRAPMITIPLGPEARRRALDRLARLLELALGAECAPLRATGSSIWRHCSVGSRH